MNDEEYIRKAVELAEGWFFDNDLNGQLRLYGIELDPAPFADYSHVTETFLSVAILDALAAQLVRQVDATEDYWVRVDEDRSYVFVNSYRPQVASRERGLCRTMNTIKAIVDSGVLSQPGNGDD